MASGPTSGGGNNVDVLMRFLLDEQAQARTTQGISDINKGLQGFEGSFPGDELGKDFASFQTQLKQTDKAVKQVDKSLEKTKDRTKDIRKLREEFSQLSAAASRATAISQGIFAVGAGTVGGIFAVAQNYVKNAEEATTVTRAWAAETAALSRSGARVGAVFAEQALPTLRQAAELAEKASRFIERNPEIIQAALKTGLVVAGLSAVGTAVTRGIKLVADIGYIALTAKQLLAGGLMNKAADKMVVAAGAMAKGSLLGKLGLGAGGAGAAATAGQAGLLGAAGVAALASTGGTFAAQSQIRAQNGDKLASVFAALVQVLGPSVPLFGNFIRTGSQLERSFSDVDKILQKFGINLGQAGDGAKKGVSGTTSFGGGLSADVVNAFIQYKEAGIQAEKSYQTDRLSILRDANNSALAINKNYASSVSQINANFNKTILSITRDAQQAELQAAQDNAIQRQNVIRDSGAEIQRIEEDLQENLRKIALESDQRIQDLVANRDALGIVRERRKRDQEMEEATRAANIEIGRRRQDLATRLNDMAQEFQLERQRRREDFELRIQEAEAQRQEELKRAAEQRAEELKQIQEAKAQKLRELDAQYREEQIRLRDAFIAKVRDLDASLLGEQQLRRAYYAQMLIDARNFLAAYRGALAGGSTGTITGSTGAIPTHAAGGYTAGGLALMHPSEFVLDRSTTKAAEDVIGGRLNQSNMRGMLAGAGGTTINLEFPGGLVTMKSLRNILEDNNSDLLKTITDSLR